MASRGLVRALTVLHGLPTVLANRLSKAVAEAPTRILIAQYLLLGDTLMLTPLLAKLRREYPHADILLTCPVAFLPLYERNPYGVRAIGFDPREPATLASLRGAGPFDLALVPADNRFAWLAAAARAKRIVAFAGDTRWRKNLPVTDFRPLPCTPTAFGDLAAGLIDGPPPAPYRRGDWPAPRLVELDRPSGKYAVVHVGASSPHKLWPMERWRAVLTALHVRGLAPVLVCGRGETKLIEELDPRAEYRRYPGNLDLAQYWHLLVAAQLLLCPDTGIAHLARLVGTPTVALFGPGSPVLFGAGEFWREMPYVALWDPTTPCRDQNLLFEKALPWVRQCWRTPQQCGDPKCIRAVAETRVVTVIDELLAVGEQERVHP